MRWVAFTSHEVGITVNAMLAGPATAVQWHPTGWQAISRMWRPSYTEWQGAQGWELDIPIVWNGRATNKSQEKYVKYMETLGEPVPNLFPGRTPILTVDAGGSIPHDKTRDPHRQWVVYGLDWSGLQIRNDDYDLVMQECTVTLWEWAPDKIVSLKELIPVRGVPKTYRIKKGDTLQKIAAYFYGDQSKWSQIAALNHLRDPNYLRVGTVIKLPQGIVVTTSTAGTS
jgi:nucleoid-associated protein YgaU